MNNTKRYLSGEAVSSHDPAPSAQRPRSRRLQHVSRALEVAVAAALTACASATPPAESGTAPNAAAAALPPVTSAAAPPASAAAEPAPPKVDSEAEKKKAQRAKAMEAMESAAAKEAARFTDALKAEVKALADAKYPNTEAALRAVLKGKYRVPGNPERDAARHPVETLTFFGLKQTSTVFEVEPGAGWYTEVLAPVLAKKGKLLVTSMDPNGPPELPATRYGKQFKHFLDKSPELSGKIEVVLITPGSPKLGHDGAVDIVLSIREAHNWHQDGAFDAYVSETFKALKPGGVFGLVAHRAKPDANPDESAKLGYLPEAWVIKKVEAGGFKLAGKSEINANPKDTKDYPDGVWTLPPTYRLGDKDHARYEAIGESDRMTLKFVKPAH